MMSNITTSDKQFAMSFLSMFALQERVKPVKSLVDVPFHVVMCSIRMVCLHMEGTDDPEHIIRKDTKKAG